LRLHGVALLGLAINPGKEVALSGLTVKLSMWKLSLLFIKEGSRLVQLAFIAHNNLLKCLEIFILLIISLAYVILLLVMNRTVLLFNELSLLQGVALEQIDTLRVSHL
jgi:hypothetical protein